MWSGTIAFPLHPAASCIGSCADIKQSQGQWHELCEPVLQVFVELKPTKGVPGGDNAITDSAGIAGAILVSAEQDGLSISSLSVAIVVVCGDGECSTGEAKIKGQADTNSTCLKDCPVVIGSCDAPGSSDVGDSTKQCGGHGICNLLSLVCTCTKGYAGDSCAYCSDGYRRNGQVCQVILKALLVAPSVNQPAARVRHVYRISCTRFDTRTVSWS
jgi:hypothetical protein